MVKIIRCKVFLEDQSMFLKNEQDNEIKIEAQKGLIENLRRQIDILKSCMQWNICPKWYWCLQIRANPNFQEPCTSKLEGILDMKP